MIQYLHLMSNGGSYFHFL